MRGDDWFITPLEFAELLKHRRSLDRQRHMAGAAMICALLANIHRDPKENPEGFSIEDFLPVLSRQEERERKQRAWDAKRAKLTAGLKLMEIRGKARAEKEAKKAERKRLNGGGKG